MVNAFSIAASGLRAATTSTRTTANNLANILTPGFRARRVDQSTLGGRSGTQVSATPSPNIPGSPLLTGLETDLSISGEGFFQVETPEGTRFTRAGNFTVDAKGSLVTPSGAKVVPEITVPATATGISVSGDGTVTAFFSNGTTSGLGQLQTVRFRNPDGLTAVGNNNFASGPAAGDPVVGAPGAGGRGTILQGALESSNVNLVSELTRLSLNKFVFQANLATIRTADEILEETLGLVS